MALITRCKGLRPLSGHWRASPARSVIASVTSTSVVRVTWAMVCKLCTMRVAMV